MRRRLLVAATAAFALAVGAQAADARQRPQDRLNAYSAVVDARGLATIAEAGFDVTEGTRQVRGGTEVDLIMTTGQRDKLADAGVDAALTRVRGGQTVRSSRHAWRRTAQRLAVLGRGGRHPRRALPPREGQPAAGQARGARPHPPGSRDHRAEADPGARGIEDGTRPAVLYSSTQHAREWISTEVNRRLVNWYIDGWRANDKEIKKPPEEQRAVVRRRGQPRRLPVHVRHERLWRKNLRDNDNDNGDHPSRRRRPQPQLPRALRVRRRGLVVADQQRHVPWPLARVSSPRRRR